MTDVDTGLEQRLEAVLVRYGVPAALTVRADRGDLSSDLADVARAWSDEQTVSKQGKTPRPELSCFEFGRPYRNKTGGGIVYVGGSYSPDVETRPVLDQLVGLSPGGSLVDMSTKNPAEWERISRAEWREQWNYPAYVNMRGASTRPSGQLNDERPLMSAEHGISADPGWHGELIERPVTSVGDERVNQWPSDDERESRPEPELPQGWWERRGSDDTPVMVVGVDYSGAGGWIVQRDGMPGDRMFIPFSMWGEYQPTVPLSQRPTPNGVTPDEVPLTLMQQALVHDDKGASEEKCTRCGWVMGHPPLNCVNDDSPHVFPSQLSRNVADTGADPDAVVDVSLLHSTVDAQIWAKEWCAVASRIRDLGDDVIDEAWMTSWFANAIETARAHERSTRSIVEDGVFVSGDPTGALRHGRAVQWPQR